MKNLGLVCVALVMAVGVAVSVRAAQEESPFILVQRIGDPPRQYFHLFETSNAKYTVRNDGLGEVSYRGGRREAFHLKATAKDQVEELYFYEYEGDVLLLYRTRTSGYLVRLNPRTRKITRAVEVNRDFSPPVIREKSAVFEDGAVVRLS